MDIKNAYTAELLMLINECFEEIEGRRVESKNKLQYLDKRLSNLDHEIEVTSFNARDGYKISKELQSLRRMRRIVKNEEFIFGSIYRRSKDESSREWRSIIDYCKDVAKMSRATEVNLQQQAEWGNFAKLGKIPYNEVAEETDKRFGSLNQDKLLQLREHMGGKNERRAKESV